MTVVVAYKFLRTIAILADCRVSYRTENRVDDNLQKIYRIDKRMVLGFSGPLPGAYAVVQTIRENLRTYPKRPVASNLQRDVERWIRHQYREIKWAEERKGLSFILATVEPRRAARFRWRSCEGQEIPAPKWSHSIPELRVFALKPSQSRPTELVKEEKGRCKIIGVESEVRDAIHRELDGLCGFAFKQPILQAGVSTYALMALLMEKGVETVGGLFQCALLSADGIQWLTYGLPSSSGSVALEIAKGQYVQRDNRTSKTVPLRPIWNWWEEWQATQSLNNAGVFEDPGLRKAMDNLRKSKRA